MSLDNLIKRLTGESTDLEKAASADQPVTATNHEGKTLEEMLTKSASEQNSKTEEENSEMNKQASATNAQAQALATQILGVLEKAAAEQEKIANEVIAGTDVMVSQDDAKVQPTPLEGNTVTGTLRDLILQAVANGAATEELADEKGPAESEAEGAAAAKIVTNPPATTAPAPGTTAQNPGSAPSGAEVEKVAAVAELIGRGHDFDTAVTMVKWAEERMAIETIELAKVASVNALVEQGATLSDAVQMVEASAAHLGL